MLNDTRIRNARPGERDYKLTDFDGLVRSNGSKLWRFAYRFDGKQKQMARSRRPSCCMLCGNSSSADATKAPAACEPWPE